MKGEELTRKLMDKLKIDHLLEHYPHQISGGEKQRTVFIRALATEPELLLLDEPLSAVDEETKKNSYQQLLRIQKQWHIPIIIVTHNVYEVEMLANKVFFIKMGN